jgi:hypothetical protein
MSEDRAPYGKRGKKTKEDKVDSSMATKTRRPKMKVVITDFEKHSLSLIADKAKRMREARDISNEQFALQSKINRNSYYRFEKSAETGDNYTVALLLKVIAGLKTTLPEFFKDIK